MQGESKDREFELKKAAISIDFVIHRLQNSEQNLKSKAETYFKQTVEFLSKGDNTRAAFYADEVARIKDLSKKLYFAEMILETVKTRLEVASIVSPLGEDLRVANQLLSEVRTTFGSVSLDFSEVADLRAQVSEVMKVTEVPEAQGISLVEEPTKEEIKEILTKAETVAAERIAKEFPEVPSEAARAKAPIEERLYQYLVERKGAISVSEAARSLGEPEDEVRKTLEALKQKGKIVFEEKERE